MMRSKSTCLLTMITVKTVSGTKSVSIFEAIPFIAYFDVIQCSLLLILTVVILILTSIHFHQTRPCNLQLSRPSSFEYYVLKGEISGGQGNSLISHSSSYGGTRTETRTGTEKTGTNGNTGTTQTTDTRTTDTKTGPDGVSFLSV